MDSIALQEIIRSMQLVDMTPEVPLEDIRIASTEVNRPALQLAGYYDYFDNSRIQIIGKVEYSYLQTLTPEEKLEAFRKLFEQGIPCVVMARGYKPSEEVLALAWRCKVPILGTEMNTSKFLARLMRLLEVRMAPMMAIHGVLVDVYGEGVLILGESGLGKSEAALELIQRGHRLVADDSVEIRRFSEDELVGSAPETTRNLMELRGIGIVDVEALYGYASVRDEMPISMVVKLKYLDRDTVYERLGMKEEYMEFLGNKVACYTLPVSPGRNIAVVVEAAAVNFRAKRMGYDAMAELERRVESKLQSGRLK